MRNKYNNDKVLVTGGSGFISQHCIVALQQQGYQVRTTLRTADREAEVRANLLQAGVTVGEALQFVVADLTVDAGWEDAVASCRFVLHDAHPPRPAS